jgi:hypothetical protein
MLTFASAGGVHPSSLTTFARLKKLEKERVVLLLLLAIFNYKSVDLVYTLTR